MPTEEDIRAIRDQEDPVAEWAEVLALFPEAGHWFNEGWHYGSLRHRDPMIRETSLSRLIDALLDKEVNPAP